MTIGRALIIGIAETLAFVPGAGRAGVTMVVGRLLGYERPDAARFAFLLSIPAIAAIAGAEAWRLTGDQILANLDTALYAALAAGLSGLLAIAFLMAFLQRAGFGIFAVYRILFGALLLYLAYGRGCRGRPAEDPRLVGCGPRASLVLSMAVMVGDMSLSACEPRSLCPS